MTSIRSVQRIGIIGAGASGLVTAKALKAEGYFCTIDVLEQRAETGGLWNYTPLVDATPIPPLSPHAKEKPVTHDGDPVFISALYDRLETNIPKSLMKFDDLSFRDDLPLFPPHAAVRDYLHEYGRDVEHLIRYNVTVTDCRKEGSEWKVQLEDTRTGEPIETREYDAVVVAVGHYTCPYLPSINGMEEWNRQHPGSIIHSKYFRKPETYEGKKVIVVGSAASGLDIASQIVQYAQKPVFQSQLSVSYLAASGSGNVGIQEVSEIVAIDAADRSVQFKDGPVEKDIDAIVFCTGYLHSLPFLSSINSSPEPLVTKGTRVHNVYQHIFYIPDPTLSFIGIPIKVIPFPVSQAQAVYVARVLSSRLTLPPKSLMDAWVTSTLENKPDESKFHHYSYPHDADYIDWLGRVIDAAEPSTTGAKGMEPARWREKERMTRAKFPTLRKSFIEKRANTGKTVRSLEELGFDWRTGEIRDRDAEVKEVKEDESTEKLLEKQTEKL